ncbi:MAG TPA: hypothetical protein VF395_09395 [Polyangiaceae bacterium]
MLAAGVALPYALSKRHHSRGPLRKDDPTRGAEEAAEAIASLSSALGALRQVDEKLHAGELIPSPPRPPESPDPARFSSPTACVRSYLPDVVLGDGSMDSLCSETDLWNTERTIDVRLAHRPGGAKHWTRLGRYSMAALATMRAGCCALPEPLTAVVPGLWCGILRDELRAFGPAPTAAIVTDYERMMRCLKGRGVRLPERWNETSPEESERAFQDFLRVARNRRSD